MAQDSVPEDQQVWPKERLRQVQAAIDTQDTPGLCDALGSWMKQSKSAFKVVLQTVGPILTAQGDPQAVTQLLLSSLLHLQTHPEQHSSAVKHLLLELLPPGIPTTSPALRALALQLFTSYCNPVDAKLSVKVASAFKLTVRDVAPQWEQLQAFVSDLLQDRSNYTAAVRLMLLFEGLDAHVDTASTLSMLVGEGQAGLAEKWAATLDRDWQVAFIEACVAGEQLKAATRAVRALGLSEAFPNIEDLYRRRSLGRLLDKQLWPVALAFVGADEELQVTLLRHMVTAGQLALANEYRQQLHLPEEVLAFDPEQLAADEAAGREAYLQLPTDPPVQILCVTDGAGLQQAASILQGATVIGMDVEWRPSHMVGQTTPAALLQVAAGDGVLLLDLLALCGGPPELQQQLDEVLTPVMTSSQVLKVGFGLSGDLSKLAGSWPGAGCWREVGPTLDLLPLWVAAGVRAKPGASTRALGSAGLSTLCASLLGKPLDKACQMSDWEQRPLSAAQQQYAALDAWVLPRLYRALLGALGAQEGARLVAQHKGRYVARRPAVSNHPPNVPGNPDSAPAAAAPAAGTASPGGGTSVTSSTDDLAGSNSSITVSHSTSPSPPVASHDHQASRIVALLQQHGLEQYLQPRQPDSFTAVAEPQAAAGGTPAAAAAAAGGGAPPSAARRVKSMVLSAGDAPLVVVAPAGSSLDLGQVAAACGCSRKSVKLVSASQCLQLTGFPPGHVPPMGHSTPLPVLLDWRLGYPRPTSTAWPFTAVPAAGGSTDGATAAAAATAAGTGAGTEAGAADAGTAAECSMGTVGGATAAGSSATAGVAYREPTPAASEVGTESVAAAERGEWNTQGPVLRPLAAGAEGVVSTPAAEQQVGTSRGRAGAGSPVVAAAALAAASTAAALTAAGNSSAVAGPLDAVGETIRCGSSSSSSSSLGKEQPEQHQPQQLPQGRVYTGTQSDQQGGWLPATIACGCGIPSQQLVLSPQQLALLTGGQVVDVVMQEEEQGLGQQQEGDTQREEVALRSRTEGRQAPCFLCDGMLGRLCRWLRVLGVDAEFVERRTAVDETAFAAGVFRRTVKERRLFLTRDSRLAARRDVGGGVVLLVSDDPQQQLAQVVGQYGLKLDSGEAMSRCSACNAADFRLIQPREAAAGLVPPRVYEVVEEFWRCGGCGKVFWQGPKSEAAMQLLEGLLAGERRATPLQSLGGSRASTGTTGAAVGDASGGSGAGKGAAAGGDSAG